LLRSSRYLPVVALGLLALIWGYTWVPLKIGVEYCEPFTFAALRTLPGGLLLLAFAALLRRPVRPKAVTLTALLGVLQTSGFIGLTIAALVTGGAGRTALLANTWQFWILLMAWPILGERLRGSQWISVGLALGGLVLIIEPWHLNNPLSSLLALAGAVCWAAGSIVVKILRRRHEVDLLALTGWQTLYGSILLVLVAIFVEGDAPEWTTEFIWAFLYTLIMATCVASFLWLFVLREMPAGIAGLGTMATPVVGLLASWAQLGEQPTIPEVVGMIVILAGMAILFARGMKSVTTESVGAPANERASPAPDDGGSFGEQIVLDETAGD
jgi:drug/metabolite transporter (DMT)-like permease